MGVYMRMFLDKILIYLICNVLCEDVYVLKKATPLCKEWRSVCFVKSIVKILLIRQLVQLQHQM